MVLTSAQGISKTKEQFPCRETQIRQLSCLLSERAPTPPALVLHGLEATGKSSLTRAILEANGVTYAKISCRECITGRHLLEATLAACLAIVQNVSDGEIDSRRYSRCENLTALAAHLEELLVKIRKFVLVLDDIDHQREAPPTLIPALLRLHEHIPNLSIVLIVSSIRHGSLHRAGVPHIHFPSYTRAEALQIVYRNPLPIYSEADSIPNDYPADAQIEDSEWLWSRFCAAVWDSQAKNVACDIVSFRALAEKLWKPFVTPIVEGSFGTRDFSRLLVAKRSLFQSEDVLVDRVVQVSPAAGTLRPRKVANDLPYYAKYLLCAAYLASNNPVRTDPIFFMKSTEKKKRRKAPVGSKIAQHRKVSRRLLQPSPFSLERLLAIFHAIIPHPTRLTADAYAQLATLSSLRLLLRSGAGAGAGGDLLDPRGKWRVNVGWEYVQTLARGAGLEIADYVAE